MQSRNEFLTPYEKTLVKKEAEKSANSALRTNKKPWNTFLSVFSSYVQLAVCMQLYPQSKNVFCSGQEEIRSAEFARNAEHSKTSTEAILKDVNVKRGGLKCTPLETTRITNVIHTLRTEIGKFFFSNHPTYNNITKTKKQFFMKATMNRQNYRNYQNRSQFNYRPLKADLFISLAMSLLTFGMIPYSFLRNIVMGPNPFSGLTTRQRRDMYWLHYLYGC